MSVALIRIDDRLIHGQVAVGWTRFLEASMILVIDDEVCKDNMQKMLLKIATPTGVKSEIVSVDAGAQVLLSGTYDNENILVIVKGPETILKLLEKQVPIEQINVGNIRSNPQRKQLLKGVNASKEEIDLFKKIDEANVNMIAQQFPDQKKYNFNEIISQN